MKLGVLVRRDLARSKRRLVVVGAAVAFGVGVIVTLGSIGAGVYRHVVAPLLPKLPLDLIKVEPRVLSLGMLAFDTEKLGGGLDEEAVRRLEKIEGASRVFPVVGAGFPLRAEGGARFLGHAMRTDLFATGVDPELVRGDVAKGYTFADPGVEGKIVPVLVARRLLDLYNTTVAPAIDRPRLGADAVIGFSFELVLGSSYVRGTPDPSKVEQHVAQIVGFSDQATLVGITVPAATLRRWNETHAGNAGPIVGAYVKVREPGEAGAVASAIERAGLAVDDTMKIAGAAVAAASAMAALLAVVLLSLVGFAIAQTFFLLVSERRSELAALRAMGARRRDLRRLVLAEALVLGVVAGLAGVALGIGAGLGVDALAAALIPDIPFKPEHVTDFDPLLLLGAWALGVAAAVGGALIPAAHAARQDPAAALRS